MSCKKRCNNNDGCNADEYISICGFCKNSADRFCVDKDNNPYGVSPDYSYKWMMMYCKEGDLDFDHQVPCTDGCNTQDKRDACLENVAH